MTRLLTDGLNLFGSNTPSNMGKSERPEHVNPPEIFYDEQEAHKYTCNSRIISVQACTQPPASPLAATAASP